jgi:hypothetical protein
MAMFSATTTKGRHCSKFIAKPMPKEQIVVKSDSCQHRLAQKSAILSPGSDRQSANTGKQLIKNEIPCRQLTKAGQWRPRS